MGVVNWRGNDVFNEIASGAQRSMDRGLDDGVGAAKAQSTVLTGNYQRSWEKVPAVLQGDTVHGEIINEARNPQGGFYGGYRSGGTSRMQGDNAHAAGLDTAATRFIAYLPSEINLS